MNISTNRGSIFFVAFSILMIAGCSNSEVDTVKNSTMGDYDKTTIGKAFEAVFDGPTFVLIETEKGEKVVMFVGYISESLHQSMLGGNQDENLLFASTAFMRSNPEECQKILETDSESYNFLVSFAPAQAAATLFEKASADEQLAQRMLDMVFQVGDPVKFQWTFTAGGESFELTYVNPEPWDNLGTTEVLDAIYQ